MRVTVRRHSEVREDVSATVEYISKDSLDAAARFGPSVDKTIELLAEWPGFGGLMQFDDPRLAGIRSFSVRASAIISSSMIVMPTAQSAS